MNCTDYPSWFDEILECDEPDICDYCTYDCSNSGVCLALEVMYNE